MPELLLRLFCSLFKMLVALQWEDSIFISLWMSDSLTSCSGEGGFSSSEEKLLIDNGFIPISLGKNVLRTETASLFILSAINYEFLGWYRWANFWIVYLPTI